MSAGPQFELDASVCRRDRGRLLIGGTPPRLVRLSEAGARALDGLLAGDGEPHTLGGRPTARIPGQGSTTDEEPGQGSTAVEALARRLERSGMIHPVPGDGFGDREVTAVVPVLDGGEALAELVRVLVAEGPVIVVDDGSRDGSAERATAAGALVIPNTGRPGPAGARNTGLRAAATELVAFVDADCVVSPGWRRGLGALFNAEPNLAVVAPRISSLSLDTPIGRYERRASPLDLGPAASRVGPGRRVAYLPAAALLARRDALLEVGGFDESMRFGEDVDLVWRLLASGRQARYVPSREALHRPRSTVAALLRQRAGYGSSAPGLHRRHGNAVAPLRPGRHALAVWAIAAFRPRLAPLALAASVAIVASRGSDTPARLGLAEVALRGHLDGTRQLARALAREWLPLTVAAYACVPRARRPLAAALLLGTLTGPTGPTAPTTPDGRTTPITPTAGADPARTPADLACFAAFRALDQGAYAVGLWREMAARRNFRAILPA